MDDSIGGKRFKGVVKMGVSGPYVPSVFAPVAEGRAKFVQSRPAKAGKEETRVRDASERSETKKEREGLLGR